VTERELYEKALSAMQNAYAPYSKFTVGAALLASSGHIYTGVNVENASYGATICAERTAFVKAISEGERNFEAIAIVSGEGKAWPCGICRQFMLEFVEDDFNIITGDSIEALEMRTMKELLPEAFRL